MDRKIKILIIGGQGALGTALTEFFHRASYWVASVDHSENAHADFSIVIDETMTQLEQQRTFIDDQLSTLFPTKFDAIICVAGGWCGGNINDVNFLKNADLMWKQSTQSSILAASVAGRYLMQKGLLVLTGAHGAINPNSTMIAYGVAKAAVHHFVQCLGCENSGLPRDSKAIAILPVILDTPNNRKWMPNASHDTWTPLHYICRLLLSWMDDIESAPKSGSLVSLITNDGETKTEIN